MTSLAVANANSTSSETDPRRAAFYSPNALEVFHSVCQKEQVWQDDRFDVQDVHWEARDAFYSILRRAVTPPGIPHGRILVLRGEAGSGKTHLMRAFRNHVHGNRAGYCGYLQMTTATDNYGRYVLSNLIDSLDDPYFEAVSNRSALMTLSSAVVELPGVLPTRSVEQLRTAELSEMALAELTVTLADQFISDNRFANLDPDLIRALCYLQRDDARIKARVLKYLRCERLNEFDEKFLPGLSSRLHDHHPRETVERLGRLMWAVQRCSLVLLIDQLEDMANLFGERHSVEQRFRQAMQTVVAIADEVPSSLIVVSCLDDFYVDLCAALTGSVRDKLENDPEPVRLTATRTVDEIEKIVAYRLRPLYEEAGVENDDPLFPFSSEFIKTLSGMRTRDVLDRCRQFRDGRIGPFPSSNNLAQLWNDHKASYPAAVPESEDEQARLIGWAIEACSDDLQSGHRFEVHGDGRIMSISRERNGTTITSRLLVGICNKRRKVAA